MMKVMQFWKSSKFTVQSPTFGALLEQIGVGVLVWYMVWFCAKPTDNDGSGWGTT